jgi:predicted DNA-binding transcriptional regulator YafY
VFVDDNWYLAIENEEKECLLLRVTFIKECLETYDKNTYQKSVLEKYNDYFLNLQNSHTLYGVDKKIARLKIDKEKSHYFSKDMKLFFPSQKFIHSNDDGSAEIEISYTRSLEILPFVKRWMPFMHIISPDDLKDEYRKDLEKALECISHQILFQQHNELDLR